MPTKPKKLTFVVHDFMKLRDYLVETKQVTEHDSEEFWQWWIDLGDQRTGPFDGAIRYVPLGYWGWTDEKPERQRPPTDEDASDKRAQSAHRVLLALEQFRDDKHDLRVYMTW